MDGNSEKDNNVSVSVWMPMHPPTRQEDANKSGEKVEKKNMYHTIHTRSTKVVDDTCVFRWHFYKVPRKLNNQY